MISFLGLDRVHDRVSVSVARVGQSSILHPGGMVWVVLLVLVILPRAHGGDRGDFDPGEEFDQFGFSVAMIHDWNNDGTLDLCIGAPALGGAPRCFVVSGRDGTAIVTLELNDVSEIDPQPLRYGLRIVAVPDCNGDGIPDLAVLGRNMTGLVMFVLSGDDGAVLRRIEGVAPGADSILGEMFGCTDDEPVSVTFLPGRGGSDWRVLVESVVGGPDARQSGKRFQVNAYSGPRFSASPPQLVGVASSRGRQSLAPLTDLDGDGVPEFAVAGLMDVNGDRVVAVFSGADLCPVNWIAIDQESCVPIVGIVPFGSTGYDLLAFGLAPLNPSVDAARLPLMKVLNAASGKVQSTIRFDRLGWPYPEFAADVCVLSVADDLGAWRIVAGSRFSNKVWSFESGPNGIKRADVDPPMGTKDYGTLLIGLGDLNNDGVREYGVVSCCRALYSGTLDVFSGVDNQFLFRSNLEKILAGR